MSATIPRALAELQRWPRWVTWRIINRDGKPQKVPFQPNGRPADSTDPETWSSYADCAEVLARGACEGIGYVFAPDDEYSGVDLDKCIKPATSEFERALGPEIHPDARAIIERLASYTELSPSGTGAHILVRGTVNGGRNKTSKTSWGGGFENYDRERFFTVTGRHIAWTPETIEARQQELDAIRAEIFPPVPAANGVVATMRTTVPTSLNDVALMEKIRSSKQAVKFSDLFDQAAPEGQESEADLGLCNILAFWLGPDPDRIDSWFRRSALMRDKWDAKRGDTTYGGYTINRALEGRTEFYGQKVAASAKRPVRDDVERDYGEELAEEFQLVDDPFVTGWKSGRTSRDRYVLTTRSGLVLDLDPIGSYAGSPAKLAAEAALQLGTEPDLKGKVLRVLRLMAAFCGLQEAETLDDRARDLGVSYLQEAPTVLVDMNDQTSRWAAFTKLRDTTPGKAEPGSSIASQSLVLVDRQGNRYVRTQWFSEYVKAGSMPGTAADVNRRMQRLGWTKTGKQGRIKATSPGGHEPLVWSFHVVTQGWERGQDDDDWTPGDAR